MKALVVDEEEHLPPMPEPSVAVTLNPAWKETVSMEAVITYSAERKGKD